MNIEEVKAKVFRKANLAKWGVGVLAAIIVAPLVWFLAYAVLGVAFLSVALGLAALVGVTIVNLAPVVTMKLANKRIAMIMEEAARNPIPTLYAGLEEDKRARNEDDQAITAYDTEITNIENQFDKLTRDLTEEDVVKFKADIDAMKDELQAQQDDLKEVDRLIGLKTAAIKRAEAIWNLTMVIGNANAKFNQRNADAAMKKIKEETAIDSVNKAMAQSRAQLRQRVRNRKQVGDSSATVPSLDNNPSLIIDVPSVLVKQEVR